MNKLRNFLILKIKKNRMRMDDDEKKVNNFSILVDQCWVSRLFDGLEPLVLVFELWLIRIA